MRGSELHGGHFFVEAASAGKPQVPPLRFAPVGMTKLCFAPDGMTKLGSAPVGMAKPVAMKHGGQTQDAQGFATGIVSASGGGR